MPRKPRTTTATRARRLLALLPHLRRGRTFSLGKLASALGATPSELAADLTSLSMCGLPPYTADVMVELVVDGDLVRVLSDPPAMAEPARLAPSEARALLSAIQACGVPADDPLTAKLASLAQPGFSAEELARALRASADAPVASVRGLIAEAVDTGEVLAIDYMKGSGQASCREIHPYALSTHRGAWYVSAWCESADAMRTFRLDRIRSARPVGRFFDPPADTAPLPMPFELESLPVAEIRFEPGESPTDREWPGATFDRLGDGGVLGHVPYVEAGWIARRAASYLGAAHVLSPPEVREAVASLAAESLPTKNASEGD